MKLSLVRQCFFQISAFIILMFQATVSEELNADISLKVLGNGFHRYLIYDVKFNKLLKECYVAIHLTLPSTLYANVNELNDITRLETTTVCSIGESNVELFSENTGLQNVTICSSLNNLKSILQLPLHLRYQYSNENDFYTNVTLPKPRLLLGCKQKMKEYRISKIDLCLPCAEFVSKWREIPYFMDMKDFVWTMPVGVSSMNTVVTYFTLLVTILCTMFLVQTVCKSVPKTHEKKE